MVLQQLNRVKEIDTQISDLHTRLTHLYDERAGLLAFSGITPEDINAVELVSPSLSATPKSLYGSLKTSWAVRGVTVPAQRTLQVKLQKAIKIMAELEADNPQLSGNLHVVAVPPFKQLKELVMAHPQDYRFTELDILKQVKKSQAWSLVIIADPSFSTEIQNLSTFMGNQMYMHQGYDCRGLGVQELLAADLQGVRVHEHGNWTLLLKDMRGDAFIPCATTLDERLVVDIDDTSGILGTNYLCPAIAVR